MRKKTPVKSRRLLITLPRAQDFVPCSIFFAMMYLLEQEQSGRMNLFDLYLLGVSVAAGSITVIADNHCFAQDSKNSPKCPCVTGSYCLPRLSKPGFFLFGFFPPVIFAFRTTSEVCHLGIGKEETHFCAKGGNREDSVGWLAVLSLISEDTWSK